MTVPRLASYYERDYCAAAAVHLLREREAKYPALVTSGTISAAAAARGLELMRVVVAQWRWVMDAEGSADPPYDDALGAYGWGAYDWDLAKELAEVARRARANADRDHGSWEKAELADLCEALAWWQARPADRCSNRIVLETSSTRRIRDRDRAKARPLAA